MTSREIIQKTLAFDCPDRVARSFKDSDFTWASCSPQTHVTDWREVGGGRWERIDEWGNLLARIDPTSKGEVVQGVLSNAAAIDSYDFPDYSRFEDYTGVAEQRRKCPDKWLVGGVPGFAFNIARKMRKLDQYLMDLILDADRMHVLHDKIDAMLSDCIRCYARAGADCIMFPEDWGTQTQLMISPAMWYNEFFPRYQSLCALAHELGLAVFMHSCGQIEEIVPWLIKAGVDLLQFDQPRLHGIDVLAAHQQSDRITFWCPVDIQKTLQSHDEALIRAEAREMLDKLWKGRGGFVAGFYSDNQSIGLESQWQEFACDEFISCGIHENMI